MGESRCCTGTGSWSTMVGWKRIVVTVGERIGKNHMTYGQGMSAELVAMYNNLLLQMVLVCQFQLHTY